MHGVIIVDDDEIMLKGISMNIPWEENGFRVLGTAANGADGLALARRVIPEIILTDIRMPMIDGISMAEQIKAEQPDVKIIFLTGYDNFQYARLAISLGVDGYLLKYESDETIIREIISIRDKAVEQRAAARAALRGREYEKDMFLAGLMLADSGQNLAETFCEGHGIRENYHYAVGILRQHTGDYVTPELTAKAKAIMQRYCDSSLHNMRVIVINVSGYAAILCELPDASTRALEYLRHMINEYAACPDWKSRPVISFGQFHEGVAGIAKSFKESVDAFNILSEWHTNVIWYEDTNWAKASHKQLVYEIIKYVKANYCEDSLSVAQIAGAVHVCTAYASTLFKKYTKINLSDHIISVRMKEAQRLLRETSLSVEKISRQTGFSNSHYFSTAFKRYSGCTPSAFRKQ